VLRVRWRSRACLVVVAIFLRSRCKCEAGICEVRPRVNDVKRIVAVKRTRLKVQDAELNEVRIL
jgi:hypothetical protein